MKQTLPNVTPKKKTDRIPELIASKRGNVSAIARTLNIPRKTVHERIQADETLKSLLADERERMVDNAEDQLGKSVDKGEGWAVCFTLKTQGKSRGYVEKQEIDHSGSIDLKGELILKIDKIYGRDDIG